MFVELKVISKIKFGEWIDLGHKDTIYQLKFGWLKFDESQTTCQIRQTFPPPNIPAIRYISELVFLPDLLGGVVLGGSRVSTSAMLSTNW